MTREVLFSYGYYSSGFLIEGKCATTYLYQGFVELIFNECRVREREGEREREREICKIRFLNRFSFLEYIFSSAYIINNITSQWNAVYTWNDKAPIFTIKTNYLYHMMLQVSYITWYFVKYISTETNLTFLNVTFSTKVT